MDEQGAVARRCSRRRYTGQKIAPEAVSQLLASIGAHNKEADLSMQLVTNNGDAFDGFRKSYGMFSGVRNYIALVGKLKDAHRMEKEGYYGERLVLEATAMGLSTCWVGTNYDKASCVCVLKADETLDCVIAIGYADEKRSMREKFMESVTHRKSKTLEQMIRCDAPTLPDWVSSGMRCVMKAPSARNLQPVVFRCQGGTVTASVEETAERVLIDLGIAKRHFEIGAGGGRWDLGNGAEFFPQARP